MIIRFILIYILLHFKLASSFSLTGLPSKKNVYNHNSHEITGDFPSLDDDDDEMSSEHLRIMDYCSFTKLEKKPELLPDPEECKKINEIYKINENYDFVNYFGNEFSSLKEGIDSLKLPNGDGKMDIIFFIGNTGSGKSTLMQILSDDNNLLNSVPVSEGSGDFTIEDTNSSISRQTIYSHTLYPKLIVDSESGYILCDNPGFQDTRSPVHEIIAAYSMRKVLQHTRKIKIVIVSTHASLRIGMYRYQFTNALKQIIDFFPEIDTYKNCMYLIATKAENTISKNVKKSTPVGSDYDVESNYVALGLSLGLHLVSDENMINDISFFLEEVKTSLSNRNTGYYDADKFADNSVKIIDKLLEKEPFQNKYSRINLMRKPLEEGPISKMTEIQKERISIRDMLYEDKDFVHVNNDGLGYPLTDNAHLYLSNLFRKMNLYIVNLSEKINYFITNYYIMIIESNLNINDRIDSLIKMKKSINSLKKNILISKNPGDYFKIMNDFSNKYRLKLDCLHDFNSLSTLYNYLENLEMLFPRDYTLYSQLEWEMPFKIVSEFVENSIERNVFLRNLNGLLSKYDIQRKRSSFMSQLNNMKLNFKIDENNLEMFLDSLLLNINYKNAAVNFDDVYFLKEINQVIDLNMRHRNNIICEQDSVVIIRTYVLTSEINESDLNFCNDVKHIIIFAMHTLYINSNFDRTFFKGKNLIIISPTWEIIGTRRIILDGSDDIEVLPKADYGVIGKNGRNGKPGGNFYGLGMNFINEHNLLVSVKGGKGQDGQDGGDGIDGESGTNGEETHKVLADDKKLSLGIIKIKEDIYIAHGSQGSQGGNSGAGGYGGYGGKKGNVIFRNIGTDNHKVNIIAEDGELGSKGKDGIPGKGGVRGCDKKIKKKKLSLGLFEIDLDSHTEYVNCNKPTKPGKITKSQNQPNDIQNPNINDSPVCIYIMKFQTIYLKNYHNNLSDGVTANFINSMKSTKY